MKRIIVLILMTLLLSGCIEEGNTGTVRRYARGMRGCGDGQYNAQVWYTDDYDDPLTGAGMRLGQVGEYGQFWCDNYEQPPTIPQGHCPNVKLNGGGVTGKGGKASIKGVAPSGCDGHPSNWGHQAHGYWGIDGLCMNVGFIIGTPPPYSPVAMWPNSGCPVPEYDIPTTPTAKGPISTNAVMAIANSTPMAAPMTIDPNDPQEPPSGFEYDVYVIRVFDTYSEVETEINPSNINDWETNYRYQHPCRFEILAVTSNPQEEFVGTRTTAYVVTDALPEGAEVEIEIVAVHQNIVVALSDAFIPVDADTYIDLMNEPNEIVRFDEWTPISEDEMCMYDPNMFSDPNDCLNYTLDTEADDFMDRHDTTRTIPMTPIPCYEVDTIRLQYQPGIAEIGVLSSKWLTYDRTLGGEDGYVNMLDFALLF